MTLLYPRAEWRPIPVSPNRARRRKGRGVGLHVAVSEGRSLFGYFSQASSDSHLYVRRDGTAEQYVDADLVSYAGGAGNSTMLWVETQGGLRNADAEPWTDEACETLADVAAWAHLTEGVPLDVMPDSRPASRGIGWHKLGVRPFVAAGGEVWSSSYGKVCPGLAKIAQVPHIVARARQIVAGAGGAPLPVAPRPVPAGPAPNRVPGVPGLPAWSLPRGHYYGHKAGPAASHGGYHAAERPTVQAIQRRFIAAGAVPGVTDWRSGWADGLWEDATSAAARRWFARYRPGQQYTDRVYSDDYAVLGR